MLNKKARRIIFIFILFLITITFKLPSVEASNTYQFGDTATGVLDDNGTLTISGTDTITTISMDNSDVKYLEENTKKVVINDGVTGIGSYTFCDYSNLTEITLPNSLTRIGSASFANCESLTNIPTPDSVTSIGESAFSGTGFTQIPNFKNVKSIEEETYAHCHNLTNIIVPSSIETISKNAFYLCQKLTSVEIKDNVKYINYTAFSEVNDNTILAGKFSSISVSENNQYFSSQDGILFNKNKTELVKFPEGKTDEQYVIPSTVTKISDRAFEHCVNLKDVTIPDGITEIGLEAFWKAGLTKVVIPSMESLQSGYTFKECNNLESVVFKNGILFLYNYAFEDCENLTSVTIPESVISIGGGFFAGCGKLTEINIDSNNKKYCSENGIIYNKDKTEIIAYPSLKGTYTIPDYITSIGDGAFMGNYGLTSIKIHSGISIGDQVFEYCNELTNVEIDSGSQTIGKIGELAFAYCRKLKEIKIPNTVTSIENMAFYYSGLEKIQIPPSVTKIDSTAFQNTNQSLIFLVEENSFANNFARGYRNYITFSTMSTTNGNVDVKLNDKKIRTFFENGSCEVEYKYGNYKTNKITVAVDWINETVRPQIESLVANTTKWTNSDVVLTVTANDGNSGHNLTYSWDEGKTYGTDATKTVTTNGTYYVYVKNSIGSVSGQSIVIGNIDKDAPYIWKIEKSTESLTKEDIQITVSANESGSQSERSGLADSAYSLDKTNWSNSNVLTITANGTYTVYVRDNAGNIAQQDITINNIDKTGPTIQLTANTTEWTNGSVKLTVSATDNEGGAGLSSSPYSWDAQQTWGTTTTRYVSSNGEYTVSAKDRLGNISTQSITVNNIDVIPPEITGVQDGKIYTNVIVRPVITDNNEISRVALKKDGKLVQFSSGNEIGESGQYELIAYDVANNVTTIKFTLVISDTTKPTVKLSANSTSWTKDNVILTVLAVDDDGGLGLAEQAYSWDNANTWGQETTKTVTTNGTYCVYVRDKAGNTTYESIKIENIDKQAPSVSLSQNVSLYTNGNVIITATASDNQSGLADSAYSWDNQQTWTNAKTKEVTVNGTYTVYVKDKVGNISNKSIEVTYIDKVNPTVELTPSTTDWTKDNITLTATATDNDGGSGISPTNSAYSWDNQQTWTNTKTKEVTANGTYTIYVRDRAGNIASKSVTVSNIDKTAPTINVTASTTNLTKDNVTLTITATDSQSNLADQPYSWDNQQTWTVARTKEVTANGTYTVYVRDKAGNVANKSITVNNIDKTLPTVNITPSTKNWTKENITLTISVNNAQESLGLDDKPYSWDGTNWGTSTTKEITTNGTYTIYVKNKVGTIVEKSITISNIDKTAPTVNVTSNTTNWTKGNVTLTVTATDNQSNLSEQPYSWDKTNWGTSTTKEVTANGTYTVYVKDKVGNIANKSITVSNIDRTAPTINVTSNTINWTKDNVTLTITATDNEGGSGLDDKPYSWDGTNWGTSTTKEVTANGTFTAYVKDKAGNVANKSITVNNIDKTLPTVNITPSTTNWTKDNVTLTISANNAQGSSGLDDKPYSWDGTNWGTSTTKEVTANGTYKAYVKNKAGTIVEKSITISNIDKTAPTVNVTSNTSNWTKGNVTLTIKATDNEGGSGLNDKPYSWDGINWGTSTTKEVTANGTYTAYVKDKAGNVANKSITVNNIDKTLPTVNITPSTTNWTKDNVTLTISVNNAQGSSGLDEKPYSWDGTNWGTSTTKEVTANGTYKVYVKNKAGTIVEKSITINNIDKIAPTIKLTANTVDGADTNTQMILTVDATDNEDGVGLSEQPYSWDEGKTWASEKTKTITENGKYVVYVKDALGNVSNREIVVSEIETYIKADINNDGKIDVTDLIILKRHIIAPNGSNWVLTGIKLLAADINGDGKVDVTDLYQLKRKVLNKD